MARGRMVNSKIVLNRAVSDLSDDTSRLAFTWLITFADVEGRTYGDPAVVRSMLFPRRADVTVAQVEGYIREWAAAGLVTWYEADGDQWIEFPKFRANQRGLDTRKEPASEIPAPDASVPSTYQVRTRYVVTEQNRIEGNRRERRAPPWLPPFLCGRLLLAVSSRPWRLARYWPMRRTIHQTRSSTPFARRPGRTC